MAPASLDMQALRESMALPCSAPPEGYAGLVAPAPTSGPTRPTPGVPFVSRRKEPKACQGRCPWTPLGGLLSSPQRRQAPLPPERGASSGGTQATNRLPRHGLTAEGVPPVQLGEKIRPICPPTQSGKSVFFCGTNPIEGVAACRRGSGSEKCFTFHSVPLSGSRGGSPWRAFGDFPCDGKVTRGGGAERPPHGGRGDYPHYGKRRGAAPLVRRECREGPASSQKAPRSPGSYKFSEDSVSIKENNSSTSSRFKSRRWCLCLPSE